MLALQFISGTAASPVGKVEPGPALGLWWNQYNHIWPHAFEGPTLPNFRWNAEYLLE